MMKQKITHLLLATAIFCFGTFATNLSWGQTKWDGGTSGAGTAWGTSTNWNPDGVPASATTDVLIDNSIVNHPTSGTLSAALTLRGLTFSNNFNTTNTALIGNGGSTARVMTFGSGWSFTNNATSGSVTFQPQNGGSANLSFTVTGNGTYTVASGGSTIISCAIAESGTSGITKSGSGTLTLSGTNTFTGAVTINSGILSVGTIGNGGVAGNLGQAAATAGNLVLGGGTLKYTGSSASTDRIVSFTAGTTSSIDVKTGVTLTLAGGNPTATTGALTLNGLGTLKLSGNINAYTGNTTVNSGATLQLGVSGVINNSSPVTINGIFDLNGYGETIGSLAGSGTITSNAVSTGSPYPELALGSLNTNTTFSGIIQNGTGGSAMSLVKQGTGIFTLTGANTYTGLTTLTAGELRLNPTSNTTNGSVTFNGGTLGTTAITATRTLTYTTAVLAANSTIDLERTNAHTINFSASNGISWTNVKMLTIYGWQGGYNGTSGTKGKIFFGTSASGLTSVQIAQIQFNNGTIASPGTNFQATLLSTGELVAASNCAAPSSPIASNTTSTTTDISWTAASSAPTSGYDWEIRSSGTAGSGSSGLANSGIGVTGTSVTGITGLTAGTTYSIYIRSNCGSSSYSSWTSAGTFGTPSLVAGSLTGFGNVCTNSTATNSFTISGTNLDNSTATVISVPTGFQISNNSSSGFASSYSFGNVSSIASTTLYVKFSPTAVQSYTNNITSTGGGATSISVSASGSGINTVPTVAVGSASNITANSADVAGTISANGCTSVTAYGIEYSTTNGFTPGTGTQVASSNLSGGSFSSSLSGLAAGTTYYYVAYATNGGGTSYSSQSSFNSVPVNPSLSSTTLTAFSNTCTNTTTSANTFVLNGLNLDGSTVTITAPTGFLVSVTSSSTGFSGSVNISGYGTAITNQTVWVQFAPTLVQSYSANVTVSGGNASSINIAASGTGINTAPSVASGSVSSITPTLAVVAGTISATGCTSVTAYGIEYSTTNGFANGAGTQVAGGTLSGNNFTSSLTSLNNTTTYYYKAYATNNGGTTYGTQGSFTTLAPVPTITSLSASSGYAGSSIVITGTDLSTTSAVTFGGTAAASFTVNSNTQITAVVGAGTSGSVALTTTGGSASITGFTFNGYITNVNSGDYNTASTWLNNGVPPAAATVTIANTGITISGASNSAASLTINSGADLTFNNAAGALAVTSSLTNNGTLAFTAAGTLTITAPATITNTGTFTSGTGTVIYNGSGAQTITALSYNNLTINGTRTTNNVTLDNTATTGIGGALALNATYTSGSFVTTGTTIDFTSASAQTIPVATYNNLSNSGNGARTLANGTIKIVGVYTPTTGTVTIGTSVVDFAGIAGQVIPASFYYSITNSNNTDRTWASSGVINIKNAFSPGTGIQTITGSTIQYSASTSLSLSTFTTNVANRLYNNLIIGETGTTGFFSPASGNNIGLTGNLTILGSTLQIGYSTTASTMTVDGDVTVTGGSLTVCTSSSANSGTLNVYGNIVVNGGAFTRGTTVSAGIATINLLKASGAQSFTHSSGTVSNGIVINVGNGTTTTNTLQLLSNVTTTLASGSTYPTLNILTGSTIDFGTYTWGNSTPNGTLVLNSGANLITANTAGLGTTGSIQTATKTLNTAANYTFNGTLAQVTGSLMPATVNNLTINNTAGVSLSNTTTVSTTLTLTNGKLDLGTNSLTYNGTISGASSSNYIKTSSTGQLKQTVGSSSVIFPVGNLAYNPITLNNTGGTSDVYGIRVVDGPVNACLDVTKTVDRSWMISEAVSGGSNLNVTAQYNTGEENNANFNTGTTNKLALFINPSQSFVENVATQAGSNPYTFNASTFAPSIQLTGSQYFAIGKDYAFVPSPFAPSLGTTTITNITSTSADLGATINNDNGYAITTYGTLYGSTSGVSTANNPTSLGTPGSLPYTYTNTRTSFTPQTQYYYRGYATNAQGNGYSPELTFYTLSNPATAQATGLSGSVISSTQIDLVWTVGATFPSSGANNKNYILLSAVSPNTPTLASTNGQAPSAGANTTIVTSSIASSATSYSNTSLNVNTTYNYLLIPYTWDGTNAATYNYLTASAPTCSGTTPDATLASDYFKSNVTTGDWSTNATWLSSHNGTTNWITATSTPTTSATSINVLSGQTITVSNSIVVDDITIDGKIILSSAINFNVNNGTANPDFILNGTFESNGNFITSASSSNSQIQFNSGSLYRQIGSGGSTPYATNGQTVTWNPNATLEISGIGGGAAPGFSASQTYGNIDWDETSQTGNLNLTGSLTSIGGRLRIFGTGTISGSVRLTGSSGVTVNIGGDLKIEAGTLSMANAGSGTGNYIMNIGGSYNQTGGTFNPNVQSSRPLSLNFTGTNKTFTQSAGTLTNTLINWTVNSGASLTLANDLPVATSRSITVNGTLNCRTNNVTGLGTFTLSSGATLGIGSAAGITSSGATGNVQVSGTRTFNTAANYIYNGTTNQSVGNGLPATVNTLQINNSGSSSNNIVTLSNQDVTISSTASTGALQLTAGLLDIQARKIEIPVNGYLVATAGNFVSSNSGGIIKFAGAATVVGTVDFNSLTETNGTTQFSTASTINNTLQLNNGASVITNAPNYGVGSTLKYNTTGTIARGLEWSATSGVGYPYHVQISNNTTVNLSNSAPTTSRTIAGDLTIDAGSKLNMNTSGDQMQADLTVAGNINLDGTLELSALSSAPIKVSGNWVRSASAYFVENGSPVVFNGINPQTIQITGGGTESFDNLVLNNSSSLSSSILLGSGANATSLDINSTLTLTSGKLNTNGNEVFVKNDAASAITGYAAMHSSTGNSYVIGNLRRRVSTTTMAAYEFPLGTSTGNYEVAKININSNADVDNLMANFTEFSNPSACPLTKPNFTVTPINGGIPTYVDDILNSGYYIVEPYDASKVLVSSPTINYDATMTFNGHNNGVTSNALAPKCYTIIKRSSLNCTDSWSLAGGSLDNTTQQGTAGSSSTITAKLSGLTSFSQFGAGFNSSGNVLPVELTEFNVALKNNNSELTWTTASERNCEKYEIERSTDGIIFEKAGEVKAAGNSNSLVDYNFTDKNVNELNAKVIYYRLRQVDVDGTFAYSQIKSVSFNKSFTTMNIDAVYPNPFIESIKVKIVTALDGNLNYQIVDSKGSIVISNTIAVNKGESTLTISGLGDLSQGIYLLKMTDGENNHTSVIQKQ